MVHFQKNSGNRHSEEPLNLNFLKTKGSGKGYIEIFLVILTSTLLFVSFLIYFSRANRHGSFPCARRPGKRDGTGGK